MIGSSDMLGFLDSGRPLLVDQWGNAALAGLLAITPATGNALNINGVGGSNSLGLSITSTARVILPVGTTSWSATTPQICFGTNSAGSIWSDNNNGVVISGQTGGGDLWIGAADVRQRSGGVFSWSSDASTAVAGRDTGLARNAAGKVEANTGTKGTLADLTLRQLYPDYTNTATVGAVTINKSCGQCIVAAGASSVVVTNSLVTVNSQVIATIATNDTTAIIKNVVSGAGSFTVTTTANVTADTKVNFLVLNQ